MMAQTGAKGAGWPVTAATYDIVVTGTLPSGDTTGTVTYFVIDTTTNTIVGQVALPNAVPRKTSVSLPLKVPNASGSYAIGTFDNAGGFRAANFLSVAIPPAANVPAAFSDEQDDRSPRPG